MSRERMPITQDLIREGVRLLFMVIVSLGVTFFGTFAKASKVDVMDAVFSTQIKSLTEEVKALRLEMNSLNQNLHTFKAN